SHAVSWTSSALYSLGSVAPSAQFGMHIARSHSSLAASFPAHPEPSSAPSAIAMHPGVLRIVSVGRNTSGPHVASSTFDSMHVMQVASAPVVLFHRAHELGCACVA